MHRFQTPTGVAKLNRQPIEQLRMRWNAAIEPKIVWRLNESLTGVFKTTEEWGFAAPAIFKINLLYGYIDLMTSPPYTDG